MNTSTGTLHHWNKLSESQEIEQKTENINKETPRGETSDYVRKPTAIVLWKKW